jgi:ADP-ribose pyrophosphatase
MSHETLDSRRVYDGKLLRIDRDRVRLPNGRETDLEIVRHPGASAVVPFVTAGEILLVRQFRYATGGYILEVPAGTLDPGEEPELCARREVEEETGHRPGRLQKLGAIFATPGFTDEVIHLWAAFDLTPSEQNLDHDEVLSVIRMPFQEAIESVLDGRITDGKSICALMLAREALR